MLRWLIKYTNASRSKHLLLLLTLALSILSVQSDAYAHELEHIALDQAEECAFCPPLESGNPLSPTSDGIGSMALDTRVALPNHSIIRSDWLGLYASRAPPVSSLLGY